MSINVLHGLRGALKEYFLTLKGLLFGFCPRCTNPETNISSMLCLCDREVACSASGRQGSNFESCVWRTVSSQSSHHPQEVILAQFSLYVHKGGLKPVSFLFQCFVFAGRVSTALRCKAKRQCLLLVIAEQLPRFS